MKKSLKYLTLSSAIARLEEVKSVGSGSTPFLAQSSDPSTLQFCDVLVTRAGASNILRQVTRGGVPVVLLSLYVPSKTEGESTEPYLTVDEALVRLHKFQEELPDDTPVLTYARERATLQPCDIQLSRHGAGNVYKRVSRGGLPLAYLSFGAPA